MSNLLKSILNQTDKLEATSVRQQTGEEIQRRLTQVTADTIAEVASVEMLSFCENVLSAATQAAIASVQTIVKELDGNTKEAKAARAGLMKAIVTAGGHFPKTLLSQNQGIIDNMRRHITNQLSQILSE